MSAAEIVYPLEDQVVGVRPEFVVRAGEPAAPVEIVLRRRQAGRGIEWAHLALQPLAPGTFAGRAAEPLEPGEYAAHLRHGESEVPGERRLWVASGSDQWPEQFARSLAARLARPPVDAGVPGDAPLLSVLTVAHDTDPAHLEALAGSIAGQSFGAREWLVLDNGSRRAEPAAALQSVGGDDPRVKRFRSAENLGIVGGSRFLLERARGRYVVLVDHDDLLYPDALQALARHCATDAADVLFSDEQKISPLATPVELIWRSDWSALSATATSPAAHVIALRRELALRAGAFTDASVQGSADWDALLRLADAGARALRVPEVLYGWRMHAGSTALSASAKRYVSRSQRATLQASLHRRGLEGLFELKLARGIPGYYHWVRRRERPRRLALDLVLRSPTPATLANLRHNLRLSDYPGLALRVIQIGDAGDGAALALARAQAGGVRWERLDDARALGAVVSEVSQEDYAKAIVDCDLRLATSDWLWEALGTLELDAATGIVGGPILDPRGAIRSLGYVAGLDGFFGTPRPGAMPGEIRGNAAYIRRNVAAAHSGLLLVRAQAFARGGPLLSVDADDALYGIEFSLRCREQGILTGYAPRMSATRLAPLAQPVGSSDAALRETIRARHGGRVADDPYYARYLSRDSARYGEVEPC